MRLLLIGGAGQLGQDLQHALTSHDVMSPGHRYLDIAHEQQVQSAIKDLHPEVVINTSAFHDVPRCEIEPAEAFHINTLAPRMLARACAQAQVRLIHVSTDYVFDGTKGAPYEEEDPPAPLNVYGASKLAGEQLVLTNCESAVIIRTTGLFGLSPCRAKPGGKNFVETMLWLAASRGEVSVVTDQLCCPTYTYDLARQIAVLIESSAPAGVYHAVNEPGLSWYDFAQAIFQLSKTKVSVQPTTSASFPSPVKRPADSRLANGQLTALGLNSMPPLLDGLAHYLAQRSQRAGAQAA